MPFSEEARITEQSKSLYTRLGGYDAIAAVVENLLPRLMNDAQLGRFWQDRGVDGMRREKQLLIDFLCASAGGPLYYTRHLNATLDTFQVPQQEREQVLAFIESTKADIIEV